MAFKKAIKHESKLRLAIGGPSGSGKTYTALAIATAFGGRVALLDTEHGSASKYSDIFDFDVDNMDPPYHPDRFVEAIKSASDYDVLILDSISHAWSGAGGLLEIVDDIARRMKTTNTFAAWKTATPIQERFVNTIVTAPLHVIATMRSKQEYVLEKDDKGRASVQKRGMAPIQRDGTEYEFDVFAEMDIDNNMLVTKSRCSAMAGQVYRKPGADVAEVLLDWLGGAPIPIATDDQRSRLEELAASEALSDKGKAFLTGLLGAGDALTEKEAANAIKKTEAWLAKQ